jgi:ABC-type phosphate transport system auxiliary subunit
MAEHPKGVPLLDRNGLASLIGGLLVILITFFTSYGHVDLFGHLRFAVDQQIGIPLLLAAKLNWHPTVDAQISALASERRMLRLESESEQIESDSERIESEIEQIESESERIESEIERIKSETEQLRKENARLAEIESKLDALLLSFDTSSPIPPAVDSN